MNRANPSPGTRTPESKNGDPTVEETIEKKATSSGSGTRPALKPEIAPLPTPPAPPVRAPQPSLLDRLDKERATDEGMTPPSR